MTSRPVAVVTGSSRGIGKHLAQRLLDRGYAVVGCSRSRPDDLEGPHYVHKVIDVGSEPDMVEMFRSVRREHGRLDVAIANAACNPALSLAALTPGEAVEEVLRTNVLGTFLMCREAIKLMMRGEEGRIVTLGSMATRHEVAGEAAYTASKAAVNAMTRVLAKEAAQYGITCNMLAPAAIDTAALDTLDPERVRSLLERNAIQRVGSMDEIADTIDWLISPAASAVTGQLIYLGGA